MKQNFLCALAIFLLGSIALADTKTCTRYYIDKSYQHTSPIAAMYGQYGIPNSEDDFELAKLYATRAAHAACVKQFTDCEFVGVKITENIWMTTGIPYVKAVARYSGCR